MPAFTLRLETPVSKKLDKICKEKGYSKTGLVKSLIRDFLDRQTNSSKPKCIKTKNQLNQLVGVVTLGGDAINDLDAYLQ